MATTPKKLPQRLCTGCGEMKPKKELVRVVKSKDGEIALDLTGRANGRGAYICRSLSCMQAARKARRFEKAFSCKIPDEIYERMEEALKGHE
ncbi:MAG: YlxR family protein [Ruminococcaceae bacterium]|nr:YlxR family protein [Oscillospiraceae bacterium]